MYNAGMVRLVEGNAIGISDGEALLCVISLFSPQSCVELDVHGDDQRRCQSYCDVSVVNAEIRSRRSLVALAITAAVTDFRLGCD
jgi:hypothetical protein